MSAVAYADRESTGTVRLRDDGFQPEVQGLRALSVLAVIWAHARLPGLPGGFTGVDVFFVISGFLITRLLLKEVKATGRIDLIAFWARRARRLLPNAYAALIGTLLLALFLFPAYDPDILVRDMTSAALEIANIHFAEKAIDYFQPERPASPFLHFWSLNVEEQFYLIWPLLLVGIGLLWRAHRFSRIILVLGLIWCVSFIASVIITFSEQPTAYFSTGTRCWQLTTGALLAAGWQSVELLPKHLRVVMAWAGLTAILLGMAIIDEVGSYPGVWALLPTLGTAALIAGFGAAKPEGALRWGLGSKPMQWVGERSYSWYLWHWPLLALPRATLPDSPYIVAIAIPASLIIACIAYSWLETPIRHNRALAGAPLATFAGVAIGIGLIIAARNAYLPAMHVVNPPVAARWAQIDATTQRSQAQKDKCQLREDQVEQPDCLYGDLLGVRRAVLFGDSHAMHWFEPLNIAAKQTGWQLRVRTKNGCPPPGVTPLQRGRPYLACDQWREAVLRKIIEADRPDLLIISNETAYRHRLYDTRTKSRLLPAQAEAAWREGLRKTLRRFVAAGSKVVIIRDIPKTDQHFLTCYVRGDLCGRPRNIALAEPPLDREAQQEFGDRVTVLDFTDDFCDAVACFAVRKGLIAYTDSTHLSGGYAVTFAPQMTAFLRGFAQGLEQADGRAPLLPELSSVANPGNSPTAR